jgi:elongation factor G
LWPIEPVSKQDLDKMGPALQRLLEEDPTVRLERTETGEQTLRTMGEAHTAVILERLKRKFGAAIATHTPKVPYKETIRGTTKVHGRYKKQTGGHGMFGDVWLELEPNPDGGVEFAEKIVGGSVPRGFFPGVEKGIREAAAEGVLAGYPLSDFKATLYDGSFHTVDSNELSFKIAASMALKEGVHQAKPALLEPIMLVEIRVPDAYMGEVNRDLNGRRGGSSGWTAPMACRSSPPTSRRPSCSRTRRSFGPWPRGVARSRPSSITTRTCRRTWPRRSSPNIARPWRPGTAGTDPPVRPGRRWGPSRRMT